MIAIPATKVTKGRFETLSNSSRLTTLLPEMGTEIAALHRRLVNQLLVTALRQPGRRGPLQNGQIGLTRKGLTGSVTLDGSAVGLPSVQAALGPQPRAVE